MTYASPAGRAQIKVPQITVYFWIVKILTTGAGESASDYLAVRFNAGIAAAAGAAGLALALVLQFRVWRYFA
jgi:uncharacterized membrane-anchored protein